MEKGKIDNKCLIVGNTSFNKEALKGMTKENFLKAYKNKISIGATEAWKIVKKHT